MGIGTVLKSQYFLWANKHIFQQVVSEEQLKPHDMILFLYKIDMLITQHFLPVCNNPYKFTY